MKYQSAFTSQGLRWDDWQSFHTNYSPRGVLTWTRFDSGELLCRVGSPGPANRRYYEEFDVRLWATGDQWRDHWGTIALPDDTPVKVAWLKRDGIKYFAMDRQTMRMTQIGYNFWHACKDTLPKRFHRGGISCYWPGEVQPAQGMDYILVQPPKRLTDDEVSKLHNMRHAARAWWGFEGAKLFDRVSKFSRPASKIHPQTVLKVNDLTGLSADEKYMLYNNGYADWFEDLRVPYLKLLRCKGLGEKDVSGL